MVGPEAAEEPKIKRLSERYSVEVDCRLILTTRSGLLRREREIEIEATLVDLSINGCGLITDHPVDDLAPGTRLTLIVDDCTGLIAVRRLYDTDGEPYLGVEFIDLGTDLEEALYGYIGESRGNNRHLQSYWTSAT